MRFFVWLFLAVGFSTTLLANPVNAKFKGADVQLQTVKRPDQTAISGLALRGRWESIDMPVGLMLMPTIERWRDKATLDFVGLEAVQRDLAVSLDAAYQWDWGGWSPYLGLGVASHFIKSEATAPQLGVASAQHSLTKIGPDFLLGVDMPGAGGLRSYMEIKYQAIRPYQQFKLNWGLTYGF
jgi:hypothetical protein